MEYNGIAGLIIWEMVPVWVCVSIPKRLIMVKAKPVWTTYQKADTDEEDDYFEQYLSRIGIDSWEGIIQDIP